MCRTEACLNCITQVFLCPKTNSFFLNTSLILICKQRYKDWNKTTNFCYQDVNMTSVRVIYHCSSAEKGFFSIEEYIIVVRHTQKMFFFYSLIEISTVIPPIIHRKFLILKYLMFQDFLKSNKEHKQQKSKFTLLQS
jgi:hypothetical protein